MGGFGTCTHEHNGGERSWDLKIWYVRKVSSGAGIIGNSSRCRSTTSGRGTIIE